MAEPEQPKPEVNLEEWCRLYAPTLPTRVECIVAEWHLETAEKAQVRDLLLTHVRQSVIAT